MRTYGLPQACLCCGNDEDDQIAVENQPFDKVSSWNVGCCLLSVLTGPIGWCIGLIFALFSSRQARALPPFPTPICQLCLQAKQYLGTRVAVILGLCTVAFFTGMSVNSVPAMSYLSGAAVLIGSLALLEYAVLVRQFRVLVRKNDSEGALVQVPYDDYPALYQRHLDNAALYGTSESLGAFSRDDDPQ